MSNILNNLFKADLVTLPKFNGCTFKIETIAKMFNSFETLIRICRRNFMLVLMKMSENLRFFIIASILDELIWCLTISNNCILTTETIAKTFTSFPIFIRLSVVNFYADSAENYKNRDFLSFLALSIFFMLIRCFISIEWLYT